MRELDGKLLPLLPNRASAVSRQASLTSKNGIGGSLFRVRQPSTGHFLPTKTRSQHGSSRSQGGRSRGTPAGTKTPTCIQRMHTSLTKGGLRLPAESGSRVRSALLPARVQAETPNRDVKSACSVRDQTPKRQRTPTVEEISAEYDEAMRIHGWRAQVHGSPMKPITPRYKYSTHVEARPRSPHEYKQPHFVNDNTFFYSTIVHKPYSYVIHPSFFSERMAPPNPLDFSLD